MVWRCARPLGMNCKSRFDLLVGARLVVEQEATDAHAPIHPYRSGHVQTCRSPLALLASWRFYLPAFTDYADGTESLWMVYPITRSKTPQRPLREALRIRRGRPGRESGYLVGRAHAKLVRVMTLTADSAAVRSLVPGQRASLSVCRYCARVRACACIH